MLSLLRWGATHPARVSLDGQRCVDRQHLEEEGQLAMEGVLNLCTQARRAAGDPLAQRGLGNAVVFDLGVALRMCAHPQLEEMKVSEEQVRQLFLHTPDHYMWWKTKY